MCLLDTKGIMLNEKDSPHQHEARAEENIREGTANNGQGLP